MAARHLYLHLPFCGSRCGYCDFVTAVGRRGAHGSYVAALLAELDRERDLLDPRPETVYLGGGTPTFTEPGELERLLRSLPSCEELTVEANPETVTPQLARLLSRNGVDRVSIGAQSFNTALLAVLERRARPDDVRRAVQHLRDAGIGNLSLDLIYGIPGQEPADLERDLDQALALEPEHLSAYELEAKPGTRFAHTHGAELERQAEALEGYCERVVERLTGAGYRWYETANFCRADPARDLRARHNLGYWRGRDYLGVGVGAVSTVGGRRWRNAPSLARYVAALEAGEEPPREVEPIDAVAGHVPGAVNLPFADNLRDGRFLDRRALRGRFAAVAGDDDPIVYCGSGVTACHNALAMEHAGLRRPRVYVGSWSGWSTDPDRPVATGDG